MNIVVIGAGRVGSALSLAFRKAGHNLVKIISRTESKASALASEFNCAYAGNPYIDIAADIIIISVNDDSLTDVINNLDFIGQPVIAHTAGSIAMDIFHGKIPDHGVFYPLQTFTKGRDYEFDGIPLFIEGSNKKSLDTLNSLALSISNKVYDIDSSRRKYLHLAAVFSCNFVNHMYAAGKEISKLAETDFEVLLPLMQETLDKAASMGPERSQTGPAIRNDKKTIEKHLDLLSFSHDLQEIYSLLSKSITKKYKG